MNTEASRQEDPEAGYPLSQSQPARLDKYNILELARIPSIAKEMVIEDWLESVYGKAAAPVVPAKAPTEGCTSTQEFEGSDTPHEKSSMRDCSPGEGRALASRPPTTTEMSAPCDVDTEMVERKSYKWRKWATESV